MSRGLCLVGALIVGLSFSAVAEARPFRVNQVPHGTVRNCLTCHVNPEGGGMRNAFGTTIETGGFINEADGSVIWGAALAAIDSDGDGRSNGRELLDPTGIWRTGQSSFGYVSRVTQPGVVDAAPVPALPLAAGVGLALGLAGIGVRAERRRKRCARALAGAAEPKRVS